MRRFLQKFNGVLTKAEQVIGSVMVIMIVLLVFVNAIARKLGHPIFITQEGSQLLFIWISMLGANLAMKSDSHMGVDLLVRKFPPTLQKILKVFSYILCLGFLAFMTYWGIILCAKNYLRIYSTLGISYTTATAAIPVVSLFMALAILEKMILLFENWDKPLYDDGMVSAADEKTGDGQEGRKAG